MGKLRRRRIIAGLVLLVVAAILIVLNPDNYQYSVPDLPGQDAVVAPGSALEALERLAVKGRAPSTGYDRSLFGSGWALSESCDMRNRILIRDLVDVVTDDRCRVVSGRLEDPYTGKTIQFLRGATSSTDVQIDHVVALSDAWQKGAQLLDTARRIEFANDPLELIAVSGEANEQKSNGDAATWLPPNKPFRCQYVARQIAVKQKYSLWVTSAERDTMKRVLQTCPGQALPTHS